MCQKDSCSCFKRKSTCECEKKDPCGCFKYQHRSSYHYYDNPYRSNFYQDKNIIDHNNLLLQNLILRNALMSYDNPFSYFR